MSARPTDDALAKLPKWAREYITDIERERETALRALNKHLDSETPSMFFVEGFECTGESTGPTVKRRNFQTDRVSIECAGVQLDVQAFDRPGGQYGNCIRMQWSSPHHGFGDIALIPHSFCAATLVAKEHMR